MSKGVALLMVLIKGGVGLTATTCFSLNITIFPSSHKGPTATKEELLRFGKLVAVRAFLKKFFIDRYKSFFI